MTKEQAFEILKEKEKAIENAKKLFLEWKEYCESFAKYDKGQKIKIVCEDKEYNGKIGFVDSIFIHIPYWDNENISIRYKIAKIKKDGTMSKINYPKWNCFMEEELCRIEE